jgi:hypothetical protein
MWHQVEPLQFILVTEFLSDNNLAESGIRPLVIMRKISGGSRGARHPNALSLASLVLDMGRP